LVTAIEDNCLDSQSFTEIFSGLGFAGSSRSCRSAAKLQMQGASKSQIAPAEHNMLQLKIYDAAGTMFCIMPHNVLEVLCLLKRKLKQISMILKSTFRIKELINPSNFVNPQVSVISATNQYVCTNGQIFGSTHEHDEKKTGFKQRHLQRK